MVPKSADMCELTNFSISVSTERFVCRYRRKRLRWLIIAAPIVFAKVFGVLDGYYGQTTYIVLGLTAALNSRCHACQDSVELKTSLCPRGAAGNGAIHRSLQQAWHEQPASSVKS